MVHSYIVGWIVAFVFAIILLFFMGDPEVAINTPAGWVGSTSDQGYSTYQTADPLRSRSWRFSDRRLATWLELKP